MKKTIASAIALLIVSASAYAAIYTYPWDPTKESPLTTCDRYGASFVNASVSGRWVQCSK
ncbi:hypothetical protein [Chitiniphilus eburneus]|uniref:Uncharacterized protein n=1 Tax=Chitiniphilus eburneus TaxID=2571148 RepID=A0A4U0PD16_9NEIS|nr:hypothetical protein [Chitiniphilus eburneus]TJZ65621.1 hypothetical protein FAZ21_17970 [Chitiniphilus eburneus]